MTASQTVYGRFPADPAHAFGMICYSPLIAVLGRTQICRLRSLDEAVGIAVKENSAASLRCARMFLNLLKDQKIDIFGNKEVKIEAEMMERETRAIVDRVIELGDGDVIVGAIRGFEAGVLDDPWSTNKCVAGRTMGVRDAQGAPRWLDHGNLPFTQDIVDFHKEKIAEMEKALGRKVDYDTVVADIWALSQGSLLSEPGWEEKLAVVA